MRFPDWPERMASAIEAAQSKEFAYGTADCCLFSAEVVLAITGVDYAEPLRGYQSVKEALAIIKQYGSIAAMVSVLTGVTPSHPSGAHRGDVVLMDTERGETLGICAGTHCLFPADVRGLVAVPRSKVAMAWRIR